MDLNHILKATINKMKQIHKFNRKPVYIAIKDVRAYYLKNKLQS